MSNTKKARALLEVLNDYVRINKPWQEKRKTLLEEASDSEKASLEELAQWFEPESR
jgi:hypothetical protein